MLRNSIAVLVVTLGLAGGASGATPFMAPAVPSGTLTVQLCPTEVVNIGTPRLVTFGVPLPRGSLSQAQLSTVRVLRNSVEVAAYVDQLTPWRHRSNAALDGTSVRVARVQFQYAFATLNCEPITVSWGGAPRTLNATPMLPRDGWHAVTTGTFVDMDGVEEPDVYAVLPKSWLANGVLKGVQDIPFAAGITDTRDNPTTMDGTEHWSGYTELDHAQKNNFYSLINQDDPAVSQANQCHYTGPSDYEPWLYDRSSAMYALYFRSGILSALREAVRSSDFYKNHINAGGFFNLKPGDAKYVYLENIAYTYWLTGDTSGLVKVNPILSALDTYNHVWQNDPDRFWTERHSGFKLLANAIAYELNGGTTQRDKVNSMIAELVRHQDGAGGAIPQPPGYVDGGFYHYGSQHDYDWDQAAFGGSGWMGIILIDAVLRAYGTSEDSASANMIRRFGNFLYAVTIDTSDHSFDTYDEPLALPRYAMLSDGSDGQVNFEDVEHALDVATGLAWAAYFADLTGQPDARFMTRANDLYFTYDIGVNYWVRPGGPSSGLPAFRVAPWRKYGWEQRVSVGFAWAMSAMGGDSIFANGFE